jgi:hypothetical protein
MGMMRARAGESPEIRLHVERLILDGVNVPPGQGHLLQASVEAELARLLAEGGVSPRLAAGGALPQVFAKSIQWTNDSDVVGLGGQIAQSVYGGIGK